MPQSRSIDATPEMVGKIGQLEYINRLIDILLDERDKINQQIIMASNNSKIITAKSKQIAYNCSGTIMPTL